MSSANTDVNVVSSSLFSPAPEIKVVGSDSTGRTGSRVSGRGRAAAAFAASAAPALAPAGSAATPAPPPARSWLGRGEVKAHPQSLGGLLQGYIPLRHARGSCLVSVQGPSLWPFVAEALGFRVTIVEAPAATQHGEERTPPSWRCSPLRPSRWRVARGGRTRRARQAWTSSVGTHFSWDSGGPCSARGGWCTCSRPRPAGRRARSQGTPC